MPRIRPSPFKPGPDRLTDDQAREIEFLLDKGFNYERRMCIDSVGIPRTCEFLSYSVLLRTGVSKAQLNAFLRYAVEGIGRLDKDIIDEYAVSALFRAEAANLIDIRKKASARELQDS